MTKVPSFDPAHPDLQVDLTTIIPSGEIPIRFINRYRAAEKVRCAFRITSARKWSASSDVTWSGRASAREWPTARRPPDRC